MRTRDILLLAGLGAAALWYVKNKAVDAAKAAAALPEEIGSAIGSGLYEFIHPYNASDDIDYLVTFPNGQRHAIPGSQVDEQNRFSYNGVNYRIAVNAAGLKVAVPV